jgi:hypothetical protein
VKEGRTLLGQAEYAPVIGSLKPLYGRWAAEWLKDSHLLHHFASFVRKPACRDIILSASKWIYHAVVSYSSDDWRGYKPGDIESALCSVLRLCWESHRHAVTTEKDPRDAFLGILSLLANRQCPAALDLRDEVLRSTGS